jgi:hypothetical protein
MSNSDGYFGWSLAISGGNLLVGIKEVMEYDNAGVMFAASKTSFGGLAPTQGYRQSITNIVTNNFSAAIAASGRNLFVGAPSDSEGVPDSRGNMDCNHIRRIIIYSFTLTLRFDRNRIGLLLWSRECQCMELLGTHLLS